VTIEALSKAPYKVPANRQIKTLVYIADSKPVIILIRGDDQLNETKFMAKTGAVAARPPPPLAAGKFSRRWGAWARPGSLGAKACSQCSGGREVPQISPTNVCAARTT
jgi:prolyl-tRNA synthetase